MAVAPVASMTAGPSGTSGETPAVAVSSKSPNRRWLAWLSGGLALLLVGGGVGWAVATVLTPAKDVLDSTAFTYVAVAEGEVGASINLNTVAAWTPIPVGANRAVGVVTSVAVADGDEVGQGTQLYSVNMRPVVVAQGEIPAYRAIGGGAKGADVAQLQAMLAATGHYRGTADGSAGSSTVAAIKAWQKAIGIEQNGVVEEGDIIFVPALPTRIALDTKIIARGATVSGSEVVVQGLPASPSFTVPVTDSQAAMMPFGTRVEITAADGMWQGFVTEHTADPERQIVIVALEGVDGSVICAEQCGEIPVTGDVRLASRIVTVEAVAGLVVPSAALTTDASGTTAVLDAAGAAHPVTVVTSARGMSVIEGVEAGFRARVPAVGGAQ